MIGREQRFHPDHSRLECAYINLLGMPVVGLRIRVRNVAHAVPASLAPRAILDAGSGPGVMTFLLASRYPEATVVGVDARDDAVASCRTIASRVGSRATFERADIRDLPWQARFDLVTCIDILEHIDNDQEALAGLAAALAPGGTLVLHVPALHRRYPVLRKSVNFDVPTHVRPGYEIDDIAAKVHAGGLAIVSQAYTYGFLETLANNFSYMITKAEKRNKLAYAFAFPVLNAIGWLGRHARPATLGAGICIVARRMDAA